MKTTTIMWFRRDLRLADHPALARAIDAGGGRVLAAFIVDPDLVASISPTRANYVARSLDALSHSMGGRLVVRTGEPSATLAQLADESGATRVFATADFTPRGRERDARVARELAQRGVTLELHGTPYLVAPGAVTSSSGAPLSVFGAYHRRWLESDWAQVELSPGECEWVEAESETTDALTTAAGQRFARYFGDLARIAPAPGPDAGEPAAHAALEVFVARVDDYGSGRDRPDLDATSRLSPFLRVGALHPRQVVDALAPTGADAAPFVRQLAWRDFYADVLYHRPESRWRAMNEVMGRVEVDRGALAEERFRAWARGETGFSMVDAGMRQLIAEGWMHNRARMVCASFLVKHLHLDWRWGASWFLWRLVDGDVASNQHGWQWVAGTGTDAAPYHRIFNPERQSERFDPEGTYARRYLGERGPAGTLFAGEYPRPMVDLDVERREALARAARARAGATHP